MGTTTQAYGEPSYWNNRYTQDPGPFDWYQKYTALAPLLHFYVRPHHRILVVGCGNAGEGVVSKAQPIMEIRDLEKIEAELRMKYPTPDSRKGNLRDSRSDSIEAWDGALMVLEEGVKLTREVYSVCHGLLALNCDVGDINTKGLEDVVSVPNLFQWLWKSTSHGLNADNKCLIESRDVTEQKECTNQTSEASKRCESCKCSIQFTNECHKDTVIEADIDEYAKDKAKFENYLVGNFGGKRLAYPFVKQSHTKIWGLKDGIASVVGSPLFLDKPTEEKSRNVFDTLSIEIGVKTLSEGLANDGYQDLVNIDISSVVIEAMEKKYCDRPELKFSTPEWVIDINMDVRDMSGFESDYFDAVIDKGNAYTTISISFLGCIF
ncbi:hypothetical protein GIB67_039645 [Kingdonia uniflora]|uniref:Uncharacterized protein n=1 Tax=Kingdonia uniflora TaxID=39325 RepID=A0A7J7MDW8_9MAGN|nr:hypothetical protein GIB67_039645 [Kingdonia uniflora]